MGIPTNEQNLAPGDDPVADVKRVERQFLGLSINAAATTVVKAGAGLVGRIACAGGTLGAVTIYDNTAASGAVLLHTVTPVQGQVLLEDVVFTAGLTIVTAAGTVITVAYR